jgi:O-antigen ligase
MRHKIHDRIFLFCAMGVAFFLPVFGRVVPPLIMLMFLNWIIDGRFVHNFKVLFREKFRWQTFSFSALYLLYLAGIGWSTNRDYGWFDLEIKLSLLVFPLIFSTLPASLLDQRDRIFRAFVAGGVVGSLILLGHAFWNDHTNAVADAFFYIPLGWHFHPSYLSMYLNLALVYLMIKYQDEHVNRSGRLLITGIVIFFMLMTMLLSSKAGLIAMFAVTGAVAAFSMIGRRSAFPGLNFLGMLFVVLLFSWFFAPYSFSRFSAVNPALASKEATPRNASESNADRVAIWKASVGIIKGNFWFGTGTGDVKDALMHSYSTGKIMPAYRLRLNAHSQYIQTFITLGISGFLILTLMILVPVVRAIRIRDQLYLLFLLVFAFNILVESMLEEQAGVVYYAFFNTLLFASRVRETRQQRDLISQ